MTMDQQYLQLSEKQTGTDSSPTQEFNQDKNPPTNQSTNLVSNPTASVPTQLSQTKSTQQSDTSSTQQQPQQRSQQSSITSNSFHQPPMQFKMGSNDFDLPILNGTNSTMETSFRQQKQTFQQMQPLVVASHNQQQQVHPPHPYTVHHMQNGGYYPLSNGFSQPPMSVPYGVIPKPVYNLEFEESNDNPWSYNNDRGLVVPIPPLHIQQQQLVNNSDSIKQETSKVDNLSNGTTRVITQDADGRQMLQSNCSRCKKKFEQPIIIPKAKDANGTRYLAEAKTFKLCQHCRNLQRQRSRRWQEKTKDKKGVCRRCGSDIPIEEQKFVLCPSCRLNLRSRKANRAAQGRCVHCSGPLDTSILTKDNTDSSSISTTSSKSTALDGAKEGKTGNYKVCKRCRENDKIRRSNLEKMGNCNRCAKVLDPDDFGKHKVCAKCRSRKRKGSNPAAWTEINNSPVLNNIGNHLMNSMNHTITVGGMIPPEQNGIASHTGSNGITYPEMMGGQYGMHFQASHYPQQQQQQQQPQYAPDQPYSQHNPYMVNQATSSGKPLQYVLMNQQQPYGSDFPNSYPSNNNLN